MARCLRPDLTHFATHVLNRSAGRRTLFDGASDYEAFMRVLIEALDRHPLSILAFCVMPNHWHFVIVPPDSNRLMGFMHFLTTTHAVRWRQHGGTVGGGPVYQGRFKAFVIEGAGGALHRTCRYVERNALRAGLVERAEDWPWGSLRHRLAGNPRALLAPMPEPLPADWTRIVNEPQSEAELAALRRCAQRGVPYGGAEWVQRTARLLGLESTLRGPGRPRRAAPENGV